MKKSRGNEMRSFLIAASALVGVLIVVIVAMTTFISVRTIDNEQAKARQKDVDGIVQQAKDTTASLKEVQMDPRMLQFMSSEMIESVMSGADPAKYVESTIFIMRAVGSAEYGAFVVNGQPYTVVAKSGLDPDAYDVPTEMPESGYTVITELNGKPGYYIEMFSSDIIAPTLGKDQFSISVLDRTEQMAAIDEYYSNERSSLIKKELLFGLIGLVVALAICLVGLRLLTRHFITRPIEELQDVSRKLMEGTLGEDDEITVDENSDFADMQRLLQSGKLLLDKMNEVE